MTLLDKELAILASFNMSSMERTSFYGKNKFLWKEQVSTERTSFYGKNKFFLPIQINIRARLITDLSTYHFKY